MSKKTQFKINVLWYLVSRIRAQGLLFRLIIKMDMS